MDVFSFRDRVVEDYGQFSRSFTQITAPDLRDFVDGRYGAGEYWPCVARSSRAALQILDAAKRTVDR